MPMPTSPVLNMRRRQLVQVAALSVLAPAAYPVQAQLALSTAINRAGRFRALSQRCAKAYTQLHLDVLPKEAREVLSTAQRLIQHGFDDLAKADFPTPLTQQIEGVEHEASTLSSLLAGTPTKSMILTVSAQADKMLLEADKATTALELHAKLPTAKLVNIAGRQRFLSQRLAKNYFLAAAGHDGKPIRDQLAQDSKLFADSLDTLAAAPMNNASIRNELALGRQQWMFFESALIHKPDPHSMRTVATTSERLLEVMNNLTTRYENELKDLLGQA